MVTSPPFHHFTILALISSNHLARWDSHRPGVAMRLLAKCFGRCPIEKAEVPCFFLQDDIHMVESNCYIIFQELSPTKTPPGCWVTGSSYANPLAPGGELPNVGTPFLDLLEAIKKPTSLKHHWKSWYMHIYTCLKLFDISLLKQCFSFRLHSFDNCTADSALFLHLFDGSSTWMATGNGLPVRDYDFLIEHADFTIFWG